MPRTKGKLVKKPPVVDNDTVLTAAAMRPKYKIPRSRQHAMAKGRKRSEKKWKRLAEVVPSKEGGCQHPRSRARGMCQLLAVVEAYPIPADYMPVTRHAEQPDVARPAADLCLQHKNLVDAWAAGDDRPRDFAHRMQCPVCAHPRAEFVCKLWVDGVVTAAMAARELGVAVTSFTRHAYYYELDKKKADKPSTRKMLLHVIEQGLAHGDFKVKDALTAMQQLSKERGDTPDKHELVVGTQRIYEMSDAELARTMKEAAGELERQAATKALGDGT